MFTVMRTLDQLTPRERDSLAADREGFCLDSGLAIPSRGPDWILSRVTDLGPGQHYGSRART